MWHNIEVVKLIGVWNGIPHSTLILQTVGLFRLIACEKFLIGNFCERLYTELSEYV